MICIGFVGIEAFDIILYMSKTLALLNYQVLIIDLSCSEALTKSILHGMDLDSTRDIIHYRGINYIRRIPCKKELNDFKNGVIFVAYGSNYEKIDSLNPDYINFITDPFPNNIDRIKRCLCDEKADGLKLKILVRNIISIEDFERTIDRLDIPFESISKEYVYYYINDYENALRCQISQDIRFKRISSGLKRIIINDICNILSDIKPYKIQKAFLNASKGVSIR